MENFNPEERLLYLIGDIDKEVVGSLIQKIRAIDTYEYLKSKESIADMESKLSEFNIYDEEGNDIGDKVLFKQKEETIRPIILTIDSGGGEARAGLALINVIKSSFVSVCCEVIGSCYSMALPIALSCESVMAHKHSEFMWHDVSYGMNGSLEDFRQRVDSVQSLRNQIDDIVVSNTNLSKKDLKKIYDKKLDKFFDAKEALKLGIADEVIGDSDEE